MLRLYQSKADKLGKIVGKVQEKTSELVEKVGGLYKGGALSQTTDDGATDDKQEQTQEDDSLTTSSLVDSAKSIGSETASHIKRHWNCFCKNWDSMVGRLRK